MTKTKISITVNADLDNVTARLATKLGQSKSQLIENILRESPECKPLLKELIMAKDPPAYKKLELNQTIPT